MRASDPNVFVLYRLSLISPKDKHRGVVAVLGLLQLEVKPPDVNFTAESALAGPHCQEFDIAVPPLLVKRIWRKGVVMSNDCTGCFNHHFYRQHNALPELILAHTLEA